jgi:uncharacterized protein YqkB
MTQTICVGQIRLLMHMEGIGCSVDKNQLAFVRHGISDIMDLEKGPVFLDEQNHDVVLEELFE